MPIFFLELRFCFPDQSVMVSFHICSMTAVSLGNNLNDRRIFQTDMTGKEEVKGSNAVVTSKMQHCGWIGNMDLVLADGLCYMLQWNLGACVLCSSHTAYAWFIWEHQNKEELVLALNDGVDGPWKIKALLWVECSLQPTLAPSIGLILPHFNCFTLLRQLKMAEMHLDAPCTKGVWLRGTEGRGLVTALSKSSWRFDLKSLKVFSSPNDSLILR